jgi:CHAT domain-containing protein
MQHLYRRIVLFVCTATILLFGTHSYGLLLHTNAKLATPSRAIVVQAKGEKKRTRAAHPAQGNDVVVKSPSNHKLIPSLESELENLVGGGKLRQGPVKSAVADQQACSFGLLVEGLIHSDMFLWMKEHKEEFEFLPPEEARRREENERLRLKMVQARRFFAGLMDLNAASRTFALVFGTDSVAIEDEERDYRQYTCVWLADQSGVRARGVTVNTNKIDDNFLWAALWPDLRVDARSAARAPRKRQAAEECDKSQSVPVTDEEMRTINSALKRMGDELLPTEVARVLEQEGGEGARLYVVPVEAVQKIPFPALPLGDGHLVDKFAIMIAPASGVIGDLSNVTTNQPALASVTSNSSSSASDVLIVGDPDLRWDRSMCWPELPFARQEAEFAASYRNDKNALLGSEATFEAVTARLKAGQKTIRYIHFATHGMSDAVDPADKGFLALNKKHLSGAEMRKLKLRFENHPIVVMSACHTGSGKSFSGGIFGLVDFWWFSGASQVVMSLWAVDDQGTNKLMKYFEEALSNDSKKDAGKNGAEFALAEAMRKLKSEERDPTIWSSFAVFGKPLAVGRAESDQDDSQGARPIPDTADGLMQDAAALARRGFDSFREGVPMLDRSDHPFSDYLPGMEQIHMASTYFKYAGPTYVAASFKVSNRPIEKRQLEEQYLSILADREVRDLASLLQAYGHSLQQLSARLERAKRPEDIRRMQEEIDLHNSLGTLIQSLAQ